MTPTEEARLLSAVLKRLEGARTGSTHGLWFAIANWLLLVVACVVLFHIGPRVGSIVYVVAGVGCVLGITTSVAVIYRHSFEQWQVLAPFVKADEVRRRIDELKPDKSLGRTPEG